MALVPTKEVVFNLAIVPVVLLSVVIVALVPTILVIVELVLT